MSNVTKSIEAARQEVRGVLRRYSLSWEDVAPDMDQTIWARLKPSAQKIRQELFRSSYPTLYARFRKRRKG